MEPSTSSMDGRAAISGPTAALDQPSSSSDRSRLAVVAQDVLLLKQQTFSGASSQATVGTSTAWRSSPDGSNLVASVMSNTQKLELVVLSSEFSLELHLNIAPGGSTYAGSVVLASDGLHTWVLSGENGTLYLFDNNGTLCGPDRFTVPPCRFRQQKQSAVILTNWSTLVVNEEGRHVAELYGE